MKITISPQSEDRINVTWWIFRTAVIVWLGISFAISLQKIDKIHDVITSDCSYGVKK